MTTMDRDAQIMAEAEKQRVHELKIAEIRATAECRRAELEDNKSERRHALIGYFGVGIAIVAVIATIVGCILWGIMDGRHDRQLRERQRNEIAQTCIRDGNIWLNGNCIPAQQK